MADDADTSSTAAVAPSPLPTGARRRNCKFHAFISAMKAGLSNRIGNLWRQKYGTPDAIQIDDNVMDVNIDTHGMQPSPLVPFDAAA